MEKRSRLANINYPLILGILTVSLIVIVAVKGPDLARRDPLERNQITKVGEKYLIPPFPIFTPGFPLGSDQLGRDLLSGLLWAVRPTLTMVALIAAIRMTIGVIIGLLAGWGFGRFSRFLDLLIAAAISVPVIIVALGSIAALGIDLGIWVFIVGLSITGWVETARIVREQTQVIRGQVFIEAARSLGASEINILFRHVLRQIMPMIWMLFSFEISSSLMLTASLGFLGYYVGGDVWVMISDTTAIATSSLPELGQMLATTKTSLAKPWPLFSLGGTVFVIVLGFTMLGEGLRLRIRTTGSYQSSKLTRVGDQVRFWMEEKVWYPLSAAIRTRTVAYLLGGVLLIAAGGAYFWQVRQQTNDKAIPPAFFTQSAVWASAKHDPYGSQWSSTRGPRDNQIAWALDIPELLGGGPAVGADGTVYIVTLAGELLAIEPLQGTTLWRFLLPSGGIGTPGIDTEGTIYAADAKGGISAVYPDGILKWYFQPKQVNSAVTGPVIAPNGTIYYTVRGILRAVSAEGYFLWEAFLQDIYAVRESPRLSPDGKIVYTSNAAFDAANGTPLEFPSLGKVERYFTGTNGELYATIGHRIFHWRDNDLEGEVLAMITWDFQKFTVSTAPQSAGAAPDGSLWMFYTGFSRRFGTGEDTRVVWLNAKGKILGNAHYATRNSQVIAIDNQAVIYTCGNLELGFGDLECQAFAREDSQPLWTMVMEKGIQALGGALAENRLYIAADGDGTGILYAVGSGMPK